MHQRHIFFLHLARGELRAQIAMCLVVFGHDNKTAGFFIQPMDNPRPQFAAHARQTLQMMQQRIHQSSSIARILCRSRARVHHHSGWLVDHGEIVVLINNVERNFFGDGLQWSPPGLAQHADTLPAPQLQRSLGWSIVHQHFAFSDHLLYPRSADRVKARGEELVQAFAGIVRRNRDQTRRDLQHLLQRIL